MLGIDADALFKRLEEVGGDIAHPSIEAFFKASMFKEYIITLKCKMEMVREEQRLKVTVVKLRPLEGDTLAKENKALVTAIKQYMAA